MEEKFTFCPEKLILMEKAQAALSRLITLSHEEQEALKSQDQPRMDAIDRLIEHAMGEKEQALGAYKQHTKDHGC